LQPPHDYVSAKTSSSRKVLEGKLIEGGFEFEIEFSTGNLALLSSLPVITIDY
jgi:hypothetical protein